jgi:hypothetical protein
MRPRQSVDNPQHARQQDVRAVGEDDRQLGCALCKGLFEIFSVKQRTTLTSGVSDHSSIQVERAKSRTGREHLFQPSRGLRRPTSPMVPSGVWLELKVA